MRRRRRWAALSVAELATACGTTGSTIRSIETGSGNIKATLLGRLADALGAASVHSLLRRR